MNILIAYLAVFNMAVILKCKYHKTATSITLIKVLEYSYSNIIVVTRRRMKMQLFFETYLIIALLFAIITICVARIFLTSKKYTFGFAALFVILAVTLPYILVGFQYAVGELSPNPEGPTIITSDTVSKMTEEQLQNLRHSSGGVSLAEIVPRYIERNIGFIILSIAFGILVGILVHLLIRKQKNN